MIFIPRPREIYKHFKGSLYQVTAIAEHTETGEQLVVYQSLYGETKTYARPLSMFTSRVDREKYPEAEQEFRFELQGPEAERQKESTPENPRAEMQKESIPENPRAEVQKESIPGNPRAEMQKERIPENPNPEVQRETDPEEPELTLDPLVLEFLEADDYRSRLNILAGLHHRITDDMLITLSIACDVELGEGNTEERYEALKACLLTLDKYECNRLR